MLFEPQVSSISKLDLHQSRRCQRIPTLSVLVGKALNTQDVWQYWLAHTKRQASICTYTSRLSLLLPWLLKVVQQDNLSSLILERLAQVTHQPVEQLTSWLANTSEYQSNLFWQELSLGPTEIRWLQWLLKKTSSGHALSLDHFSLPSWLQKDAFFETAQGVAIVEKLLSKAEEALPGILVKLSELGGKAENASAIMALSQLVEAIPTIPICLCLTDSQADVFLSQLSESRAKAMVRSGLIEIQVPEPKILTQWLCDRNITNPTRQQTILQLTEKYGTTTDFLEATVELTQSSIDQDIDQNQYRSQAEYFLFQCLEGRPQTAGKFQVNQKLDIRFGNRPMEVDFLADTTKIVIEIDGFYHFQSSDNYRRDRRKDVELQHHGFLVIRFLADDVVAYLEDILSTIDRALTHRSN